MDKSTPNKTFRNFCFAIILVASTLFVSCQSTNNNPVDSRPVTYVDPFIGTGFHGHTFPGATTPFGMVQLSPDTRLNGWDACSGYHFSDTTIFGFSHTHLSGTGIGDLGDILVLPYSGVIDNKPVATFQKQTEAARPGYYSVHLNNFDVKAEMTATKRAGFHRYSFNNPADRNILIDLGHILQKTWGHKAGLCELAIINDHTIEGIQKTSGWAYDHRVAFRAEFSEPFVSSVINNDGKLLAIKSVEGTNVSVRLKFKNSTEPLLVKVGISMVDTDGARKNLEAEIKGWDFEEIVNLAENQWNDALSKIKIECKYSETMTVFYTGLYHSMIAPYTYSDIDGRYLTMRREIKTTEQGKQNYSVFSLWDTFRALHPLLTIIEPDKNREMVESLMQKHREGGILPKWELASNYTGTMIGYPSVSVLADAVAKGLYQGDKDELLQAVVYASSYNPEIINKIIEPTGNMVMAPHIYFKEKTGFVPSDSLTQSVSYGLEMAYYDWCVSKIAAWAGNKEIELAYLEKANYYKNYFDPSTGFMRGKLFDGSWRNPFNPKHSDHEHSDYTEGNAYQWSFLAPHDPDGLMDLFGGKEKFETKLDSLFTTSSEIIGQRASGDITGLIGQYAHGNEPSHHMAYLYSWTDSPHKTQEKLDYIMRNFYKPTPDGIIGNEDCGQMSAWYVMNALGFYQVCPGKPEYSIGRPIIDRAIITVGEKEFEIVVHDNSPDKKFVKEVRLNGKTLNKLSFSHNELTQGGKLEFFMSSVFK